MPQLPSQKPRVMADAFQQVTVILFGQQIDAAFVRLPFDLRGGEPGKFRPQKIMTEPSGAAIRCLQSVPLS